MIKKVVSAANLKRYNLQAMIFYPVPPIEIDELHYYVDDLFGDQRGLS